MAWNQSVDRIGDKKSKAGASYRARVFGKAKLGIALLVITLVIAVLIGLSNMGEQAKPVDSVSGSGSIANVIPTNNVRIASVTNSSPAKVQNAWQIKADKLMEGRDPDDWAIRKGNNGEPVLVPILHPARIGGKKNRRIFKHFSESQLSGIVCGNPDDRVIGFNIDDKFKSDLKLALDSEIVFDDEDTDDDRERKQAVIEAKKILKEAIKNGEDPYSLISEAVAERNRLATLKDNLQYEIAQAKRDGKSEEEISSLRNAANEMLKGTGARLFLSPEERRAHIRQKQQERIENEGKQ